PPSAPPRPYVAPSLPAPVIVAAPPQPLLVPQPQPLTVRERATRESEEPQALIIDGGIERQVAATGQPASRPSQDGN
ncbi:hypothetical protein ACPXAV_26130, partial [Escherichia coli]